MASMLMIDDINRECTRDRASHTRPLTTHAARAQRQVRTYSQPHTHPQTRGTQHKCWGRGGDLGLDLGKEGKSSGGVGCVKC